MCLRFALMLLCCLLCLASLAMPAETDSLVGHVINFEGNWTDKKCECKIEQGHAIWNSSSISRLGLTRSNARLTIRLAATGKPEEFDCAKLDCAEPLDIRARIPKKEETTRIGMFLRAALAVVLEDFSGENRYGQTLSGYARAFSRGPSTIPISDAIVPLHNGTVDISNIFTSAAVGTYLIEWCPVGKTGKSACPDIPAPSEFHWLPNHDGSLSSNSIQPSLYELFLCRRQGDRIFRRESAFVLVTASEQKAEQLHAQYQEFLKLMEGWNPREVSMLQHAYLQHLSLIENR